jgi:uncharacterized membrane protein (GlpM family)
MKKLINDPNRVTREMLEGLVAINPTLALLNDDTVVVRRDLAEWRKKAHVAAPTLIALALLCVYLAIRAFSIAHGFAARCRYRAALPCHHAPATGLLYASSFIDGRHNPDRLARRARLILSRIPPWTLT